jgi:hypothetical protein
MIQKVKKIVRNVLSGFKVYEEALDTGKITKHKITLKGNLNVGFGKVRSYYTMTSKEVNKKSRVIDYRLSIKRNLTISFKKQIAKGVYEALIVKCGLMKKGKMLPVTTMGTLFKLIAYDSYPTISINKFTELYKTFVEDPANEIYIIDNVLIAFGQGLHSNTVSLSASGLLAFSKKHNAAFQFDERSLDSYSTSIMRELFKISEIIKNKRKLPDKAYLDGHVLLLALKEKDILSPEEFILSEVHKLLSSGNVFYVMLLKDLKGDLQGRAGKTGGIFKVRLREHPAYLSDKFFKMYSVILFKDSEYINSETFENNFFQNA